MHVAGHTTRQRLEGVSVETELEHVSRLAFDSCQLRVDWFVRAVDLVMIVNANQKVGDAANPLVDEGHLVDDVMPTLHRVANPGHPLQKRLVGISSRYLVDATSLIFEVLQAITFVLGTFFDKQIG
jgi:hypothetical protein